MPSRVRLCLCSLLNDTRDAAEPEGQPPFSPRLPWGRVTMTLPHDTLDAWGDELMKGRARVIWACFVAGAAATAVNCGSSDSSTSPSPSPSPGGGTTITITNNTVSPNTLTVKAGSQVTF